MTLCFLISKYDEFRRSGLISDWTSFEDVGESFNGEVLTASEYRRVEDLYISALESLIDALQVDRFKLSNLVLNEPAPSWLGPAYDGGSVERHTALRLLRHMLRHGLISCVLESGDVLRVAVETDFYVSVEIQPNAVRFLEQVKHLGLHVVPVAYAEEEIDAAMMTSRTVDGEFWEEVSKSVRSSRGATVVLERWAKGSYGFRWHPVFGERISKIVESVRPHSLITAYFDVNVQWTPRRNLATEVAAAVMGEEIPVVIFSQSIDGGVPQVLVLREGDDVPADEDVPPGHELGFFLWPDEDSTFIQAVVRGGGCRSVQ
ncbi:hypothetical protein ACF09Z_11995 [Streptomyces erythrochromogenes]|uniref:hypothetical protein n=1 Tax=Streptomyces erythrochromogenes TaxID=285574 RepID=UPI0036FE6051